MDDFINNVHWPKKKKSCTPLALIMAHIHCGIVLTTLSNVTTCISIQNCINLWPRSCIEDRRVKPLCKVFSSTKTFNGVKVRTVVANSCMKMFPNAP